MKHDLSKDIDPHEYSQESIVPLEEIVISPPSNDLEVFKTDPYYYGGCV